MGGVRGPQSGANRVSVTVGVRALEYRPAIDGLRAIAVLAVFLFHLDRRILPGGFLGVDVFFVISGYLITSILMTDFDRGRFSLAKFYQRRIARILPALFVVGLAIVFFAWLIFLPQDFASAGVNFAAAVCSIANLKFMLQGNYFQISSDAQPFLHYWSLSVEEQFYLVYPTLLFLLLRHGRKYSLPILGLLFVTSCAFCITMTSSRPVWAFYLLPTRGWELLAGCWLAMKRSRIKRRLSGNLATSLAACACGMIGVSFFVVHDGIWFPGLFPLPCIVGTFVLLSPAIAVTSVVERWLATPMLGWVGKISYSLYLWHWPVFSFVDYGLYLHSGALRILVKLLLSTFLAVLSFFLLERPSRLFLNQRCNRLVAYGFLVAAVVSAGFLGLRIRRANYVNAELRDVHAGGLQFNPSAKNGTVILMGDSNGSMYGRLLKNLCDESDRKLVVISCAAGDPLPGGSGDQALWLDSLAVVQWEKPDVLILACAWVDKLAQDRDRLAVALHELAPNSRKLLILNQPPVLPDNGNREAIRNGARPPFFEESAARIRRLASNEYLKSLERGNVQVVDVASHFQRKNGEVVFLDAKGRQLFQDKTHLSGFGAAFLSTDISRLLLQ